MPYLASLTETLLFLIIWPQWIVSFFYVLLGLAFLAARNVDWGVFSFLWHTKIDKHRNTCLNRHEGKIYTVCYAALLNVQNVSNWCKLIIHVLFPLK